MNITPLDNKMSKPVAFLSKKDSILFKQNMSHKDVMKSNKLTDLWFKFKTKRLLGHLFELEELISYIQ